MASESFTEGVISSDLILYETTDGVRLVDLWSEIQSLVATYNQRTLLVERFLGYRSDSPEADRLASHTAYWMRVAEFGKADTKNTVTRDLAVTAGIEGFAASIGWTRLAEILALSSSAIRGRIAAIIEEDARFRYRRMLQQFYDNTSYSMVDIVTGQQVTQDPFYNGDSRVPPARGYFTFSSGHQHYAGAASGTITAAELDATINHVAEHGYTKRLIAFCNEDMADLIAGFTTYFSPFVGINPYTPNDDVNRNNANVLMNISVGVNPLFRAIGVWKGKATVMICPEAPTGYIGVFSHEGDLSPNNPLLIKEPEIAALRGLRTIQQTPYPFVNVDFEHYHGVGVRTPGNGAVRKNALTYTVPDMGV